MVSLSNEAFVLLSEGLEENRAPLRKFAEHLFFDYEPPTIDYVFSSSLPLTTLM